MRWHSFYTNKEYESIKGGLTMADGLITHLGSLYRAREITTIGESVIGIREPFFFFFCKNFFPNNRNFTAPVYNGFSSSIDGFNFSAYAKHPFYDTCASLYSPCFHRLVNKKGAKFLNRTLSSAKDSDLFLDE